MIAHQSVLSALLLGVATMVLACDDEATTRGSHDLTSFEDVGGRRQELVASLTRQDNVYAHLRLTHYATGDAFDWDRLPVWNPRTEPLSTPAIRNDVAAPSRGGSLGSRAVALEVPESSRHATLDDLEKLGEAAFFHYPVKRAPFEEGAWNTSIANRGGLWLDEQRGFGGLVRTEMNDGSVGLELTCATCHAAPGADGVVVPGLPNHELDLGALAAASRASGDPAREALLSWGPGRVDVTTDDGSLPVRIPDLRPTKWLSHLQIDATVRQLSLVSLAIRVETLIITAHDQALRPPRGIALALAVYLWGLTRYLPETASSSAPAVFEERCSRCHDGVGLTGPPVPFEAVGTDPTAALSPDRGTGLYRVPSLRGLSTRGPLFHDGSIATPRDLMDPSRLNPDFDRHLHGRGSVSGHTFGLDLEVTERTSLVQYLLTL